MKKVLLFGLIASLSGCASFSSKHDEGVDVIVRVEGYPLTIATINSPPGAGSYEVTPQHVLAFNKPKPVVTIRPAARLSTIQKPKRDFAPAEIKTSQPIAPPKPQLDPHVVVHFEFDRADLSSEDQARLAELAEAYSGTVLAIGFTDSKGSARYNDKLSLKRAFAVKEFLVQRGFRPDNVHVRGDGESHPLSSNTSEEGRAKNRRADVEFTR